MGGGVIFYRGIREKIFIDIFWDILNIYGLVL